jgi:hypothetical protein
LSARHRFDTAPAERGYKMRNKAREGIRLVQQVELEEWLSRAHRHGNPIMAAGRHFNALIDENGQTLDLADYDDLYDVANLAVTWLEDNPCPDNAVGKRLTAQMMGYRAVADTVRATITGEDGDAMGARLRHLRDVIDQHAEAIDGAAPSRRQLFPENDAVQRGSVMHMRRRVPRQPAGWDGSCHIEGESAETRRECRVIDISMLGLGITLNHPNTSEVLGRHISVDVAAVGDSVSIRLEGVVTNAQPTLGGAVRIGIAFDELSQSDAGMSLHSMTNDLREDVMATRRSQ